MGFLDLLKGNQYKEELENLQIKYDSLKNSITPDMQDALSLKNTISNLQENIVSTQNTLNDILGTITTKNKEISSLVSLIAEKQRQIICLDDEILVQEFGLYKPYYDFANASGYKDSLSEVREHQKYLIKNNRAVKGNTNWTVNESAAKGRKW